MKIEHSPLGKSINYISDYNPDLLFPILRSEKRAEINISDSKLPFKGIDVWNAFEISWLNQKGKPVVALGEFSFPCESPHIIESKSFKLYLNSINQAKFSSLAEVENTIRKDLTAKAGKDVLTKIMPIDAAEDSHKIAKFSSECLDGLDIECDRYQPHPAYLTTGNTIIKEAFHTHLLKSNCLITGQPDWGSLEIMYKGKQINRAGLLKYIISLRNHNEFHEQCVERIFINIMTYCQPESLTVEARYTRRGGLDINPIRTTEKNFPYRNRRLCRQ